MLAKIRIIRLVKNTSEDFGWLYPEKGLKKLKRLKDFLKLFLGYTFTSKNGYNTYVYINIREKNIEIIEDYNSKDDYLTLDDDKRVKISFKSYSEMEKFLKEYDFYKNGIPNV